jgi:hypothetical protein
MAKENTTTKPYAAQIKRQGTRLFDQQMWCFGQDIRYPEGNLFLEYGFTRERPPEGINAGSNYIWHGEQHQLLMLWGFGLFYSQQPQGGIFLQRFGFHPHFTSDWQQSQQIWSPRDFSLLTLPCCPEEQRTVQNLLVSCLLWIISYEEWIEHRCGHAYRHECLKNWKKHVIAADQMTVAWRALAKQYQSLYVKA